MATSTMESKGFFACLFDFGFTSFITLKFLRLIYGLLVGLIILGAVVFLIAGLSQGGATAALALIGVPAITLVYLVFTRISMEVIALFFRIGENTTIMAAAASGQTPPPPAAGPGYGTFGGPGDPGSPPSAGSHAASPAL